MPKKVDIHTDYDLCRLCGGQCCTKGAGVYLPDDFREEITVQFITNLLDTGKVALDCWDGTFRYSKCRSIDNPIYVRPRHKGEKSVVKSYGGQCVNWSINEGCSLSEEERPYQCRMLVPNFYKIKDPLRNPNRQVRCKQRLQDKAKKPDMVERWLPHQEILGKVWKSYECKDFSEMDEKLDKYDAIKNKIRQLREMGDNEKADKLKSLNNQLIKALDGLYNKGEMGQFSEIMDGLSKKAELLTH